MCFCSVCICSYLALPKLFAIMKKFCRISFVVLLSKHCWDARDTNCITLFCITTIQFQDFGICAVFLEVASIRNRRHPSMLTSKLTYTGLSIQLSDIIPHCNLWELYLGRELQHVRSSQEFCSSCGFQSVDQLVTKPLAKWDTYYNDHLGKWAVPLLKWLEKDVEIRWMERKRESMNRRIVTHIHILRNHEHFIFEIFTLRMHRLWLFQVFIYQTIYQKIVLSPSKLYHMQKGWKRLKRK